MKHFLVMALTLSTAAVARPLTVTPAQLEQLRDVVRQLSQKVDRVAGDFGTFEVMPRERDRRDFQRDLRNLKRDLGAEGVLSWIDGVVTAGPVGEVKRIDLPDFNVVGIHDETRSEAVAAPAHAADCQLWTTFLRDVTGEYFDAFTCGNLTNISPSASFGYLQYQSRGTLSLRIPAGVETREVAGGNIVGNNGETRAIGVAYKAWRDVCHTWIRTQKANYGRRFVGAMCGFPQNISPSASFGYLTYRSTAKLFVRE